MDKLQKIIEDVIKNLIENSTSEKKLMEIEAKHLVKIHFVPKRYRILGGILQSMNIQFGNMLQDVVADIIADTPNMEIMEKYSGKKSNIVPIV